MIRNRSRPPGVFTPEPAIAEAADRPCGAFGFQERWRINDHRVQLGYGGASMVVTGRGAGLRAADPAHAVMVRVPDVDSHRAQAPARGAKIVRPPADCPHAEHQYAVEDIGGHRWVFSQSIADVDPCDWGGTPLPVS